MLSTGRKYYLAICGPTLMVSRENKVIVAFIALAVLLVFLLAEFFPRYTWAIPAILIGVGVLVPLFVNTYLERAGR